MPPDRNHSLFEREVVRRRRVHGSFEMGGLEIICPPELRAALHLKLESIFRAFDHSYQLDLIRRYVAGLCYSESFYYCRAQGPWTNWIFGRLPLLIDPSEYFISALLVRAVMCRLAQRGMVFHPWTYRPVEKRVHRLLVRRFSYEQGTPGAQRVERLKQEWQRRSYSSPN